MSTHNMFLWRNKKTNYVDNPLIWTYALGVKNYVWRMALETLLMFSMGVNFSAENNL